MLPLASASAASAEAAAAASAAASAAAPSAAAAIELRGLHKAYGRRLALHDLTLSVRPGEVFGFLGPNGAGKTTTVKILLGLVQASAGDARIFGCPVGDRAVRRRVGYLPENFRFHDWLSGEELLDFHGRLGGLSADERRRRIPEVLALVGLEGRGRDRIRGYSKGMTQRVGLAQALLCRPDLVLLDEPTSALDPLGRREVRDVIRTLRQQGTTVFLNSHLLSEVELICDRVAIVDRGRVVREGRLADLVQGDGSPELRLTLDRVDPWAVGLLERFGRVLAHDATTATLAVEDPAVAPALVETLVRAGYRLSALVPVQRSLEDAFVELVSGGDR